MNTSLLRKIAAFTASISLLGLSGVFIPLLQGETTHAAPTECWDGIDNDKDGKFDYPEDEDCSSLDDEYESPPNQALFVSVTDGKEEVTPGNTVIYNVRLRQDREPSKFVNVTLHLPPQVNIVSADHGGRILPNDRKVVWDHTHVEQGQTRLLSVQVHVNPKALEDKLMIARVVSENVADTDTTYLRVRDTQTAGQRRFRVRLSDNQEFTQPDAELLYTLRVKNTLDYEQTTDVHVTLPQGTNIVGNPHGATVDRDKIVWNNQTFAGQEDRIYTFRVRIQKRARDNTAIIARARAGNDSDTDRTTVRRGPPPNDVTIAITDNRTTVEPGQLLTYSIHARNRSQHAAVDPLISASISTFAEFVSANEGGYWDGKNVRWEGLDIAANGIRNLSFTVRVRSDAPIGGQIIGGAKINGMEHRDRTDVVTRSREEYQGARSAHADRSNVHRPFHTPVPHATATNRGLKIEQEADRTEAVAGGRVRYRLRVTNTSRRAIDNANVAVAYDNRAMEYISSVGTNLIVDGRLEWRLPRLERGETWETTYVLGVRHNAPHGARTTNVASVDDIYSSTSVGVIHSLPQTGAALDAVLFALTSGSGLVTGGAFALRRKKWLL